MSDHIPDDLVQKVFSSFLSIFDSFASNENLINISNKEELVDRYNEMVNFDLLKYYEKDDTELTQMIFSSIGDFSDLFPMDKKSNIQEQLANIERLKSVNKDHISSDIVRERMPLWTLATRVLRIKWTCDCRHKLDIEELIIRSEKGDHEAFLKLVKLDSIFLTSEYGRKILSECELREDQDFKKKLSKALKPDLKFWNISSYRNYFALHILSKLGYEDKPYPEWSDFLEQNGFKNYEDERTVAKACNRYKVLKNYPK